MRDSEKPTTKPMKMKAYKDAIIAAHYHPSTELVDAVKEDHDKLLDPKLIDGTFKRLYRPEELLAQSQVPVQQPAKSGKKTTAAS